MVKGELIQFGFDPSKVVIKPEAWKFGSNIPLTPINRTGQYDDYLPVYEPQAEKYETCGCTVWGSQNQLEIMIKFIYGFEPNYYEGYNYNIVGINFPGCNPDDVYESIRKNGVLPQQPMPDTYEEFCKPRPVPLEMLQEGQLWLLDYEYSHEWIIPSNPSKMKELIVAALPYSVVGLSVTAWFQDKDGLYIDNGLNNTHWCVCYGYRYDEQGRIILKIFDSYDHSKKELHPDHNVMFAKRINISKKTKQTWNSKSPWWRRFINWLNNLI